MRVIIIGAGILGSTIAWHLSREGAQVRIISNHPPGGLASANSWSWINASWGNPAAYFKFRHESMRQWERLAQEVPQLSYQQVGSLTYDLDEEPLKAFVAEQSSWGYRVRLIGGNEIADLEPSLIDPPNLAAHAEEEAMVEPLSACNALIADSGVRVLASEVHGLIVRSGKIAGVMTAEGAMEADYVVIAAGEQSGRIAATAGVHVPISAPAGVLVHTDILPPILQHLIVSPHIHIRQTPEGRLLAGSDFGGSPIGQGAQNVVQDMMGRIRAMLHGAENVELYRYSIGYRPTPEDGLPIISKAPNMDGLYVAVMHSGITNAPAAGAYAAKEILTNERDGLLAPFGLERFQK